MIQRYHVDLAVIALALGLVVLVVTARVPVLGRRAVALSCAVGAAVGSLTIPRGWVWVLAALLVALPTDNDSRPHPLGRFTLPLAVVALVGIWTGVPDTEPPISVGLVLLPVALHLFVKRRAPGPVATLAVVVAMMGVVWTGSALWGAALATAGAVGLIATAPVVLGFGNVASGRRLTVLVAAQGLVGLLLPRFVMSRSVAVAVGVAVLVNVALVAIAYVSMVYGSPRRWRSDPVSRPPEG